MKCRTCGREYNPVPNYFFKGSPAQKLPSQDECQKCRYWRGHPYGPRRELQRRKIEKVFLRRMTMPDPKPTPTPTPTPSKKSWTDEIMDRAKGLMQKKDVSRTSESAKALADRKQQQEKLRNE